MKRLRELLQNHRLASVAQVMGFRVLALAVNMATGMMSAWMLGPQGRGVQTAMTVGPQFLTGIFDLGLHTSLIFNMKDDPRHEREFFGCALAIAAAVGVLGMAIGWAFTPVFLQKYDAPTIFRAQLFMAVVPIGVLSNVLVGALEGHGRFGVVSRLFFLGSLATLVGLASLWAFGLLTPATAASAYVLPSLPSCVLLWLWARQNSRPELRLKLVHLRRMLYYALRFFGIDLFATVGGYLDQFILVLFLSPYDVGIYAVAISASRVLTIIPTSIVTVLFPTVAGRSRDAIVEIVGVAARTSSVLTATAAFGLALLAPYLLTLLYGAKFEEATAPFRLLLAYTVVSSLAGTLYQMFSAAGRPEIVTAFEFIGVAASGACMLVLVPYMGTLGAALSLLIAATLRLMCVLAALPLILGLPVPRLILNKADILRVLGRQGKSAGSNDLSAIGTS